MNEEVLKYRRRAQDAEDALWLAEKEAERFRRERDVARRIADRYSTFLAGIYSPPEGDNPEAT